MRSQQFYNFTQNVEYPFDDAASLMDDSGLRLPEGLLADLSCVIDRRIANRIFCSSVTKSANRLSLTLSADNDERTPLALLSEDASVGGLHRYATSPQLALRPLTAGFKGQVVLGEKWPEYLDGSWTFSDPRDSIIAARCCFPISTPAGQRVSVMNAPQHLTGLVNLRTEGDIEVTFEPRVLGGETRQAIVLSLVGGRPEVLQDYLGPNQLRPESRTCGELQPIETINGVSADCCGRVYLELRGCAQPIPISNQCGVVLDCPLTLDEICPTQAPIEENPDQCLADGQGDPINPVDNQPGFPTIPPPW